MTLNLKADLRTLLGKKSKNLKNIGKIPAVVFGNNQDSSSIELDYISFEKIFKSAGESTIIELDLEGKKEQVIISEVQLEPVKSRIIHADLKRVNMKKEITAKIPLELFGESRAVKEDAGVLIHNISEIEIKCLPDKLIHEIKIDISKLENLEDTICIKDLPLPKEIEILHHELEDIVVMAAKPKAEKVEDVVVEENKEETTEEENKDKKTEESK